MKKERMRTTEEDFRCRPYVERNNHTLRERARETQTKILEIKTLEQT